MCIRDSVYRVPEVTEAGVAVGVIVDDVHAGNLPQVVFVSYTHLLYYKTRSLMACILIHIMNNGLSVYLSLKHPEMEDVTHLLSKDVYKRQMPTAPNRCSWRI